MEQYVFVIRGEPAATHYHTKNIGWTSTRQAELAYDIQLKEQFNHEPMEQGPLSLNLTFYCKVGPRKQHLTDKLHVQDPDLHSYILFFLRAAKNIVFTNMGIISQITAQKIYSNSPHTECVISVIK